jgi:hypothetical protein
MSLTLTQIEYIAREVHRQGDGPLHVYWMAQAWEQAEKDKSLELPVTPGLIEQWGRLVEPAKNADGFRTGPVWIGGHQAPLAIEVRPRMADLCRAITAGELSADIGYRQMMVLHPFRDGNGRTAKIMLCYALNCLDAPVMPTNWFNVENP